MYFQAKNQKSSMHWLLIILEKPNFGSIWSSLQSYSQISVCVSYTSLCCCTSCKIRKFRNLILGPFGPKTNRAPSLLNLDFKFSFVQKSEDSEKTLDKRTNIQIDKRTNVGRVLHKTFIHKGKHRTFTSRVR